MLKIISKSKYFQSLVNFLYLIGALFALWLAYTALKALCSRKRGNAYNANKHRPSQSAMNHLRQQKLGKKN